MGLNAFILWLKFQMMTVTRKVQDLRRELAGRYQLGNERHNLCGRQISVACVEDAEALFSRLVVADPDSLDVQDERLPYWACLWPAGLALARLLVSGDHLRPGERVLELGCGLGLVSAAACLKRTQVTATDHQPDALKFTRINCLQIAGVEPDVLLLDWRDPPGDRRYAALLGADLVYETRFYEPLIACFDTLLEPEGRVLFCEPNREMSRVFFDRLPDAGWRWEATVYRIARAG